MLRNGPPIFAALARGPRGSNFMRKFFSMWFRGMAVVAAILGVLGAFVAIIWFVSYLLDHGHYWPAGLMIFLVLSLLAGVNESFEGEEYY